MICLPAQGEHVLRAAGGDDKAVHIVVGQHVEQGVLGWEDDQAPVADVDLVGYGIPCEAPGL